VAISSLASTPNAVNPEISSLSLPISFQRGWSFFSDTRPDHKFRISGGCRNDVTALGPRQALINGKPMPKIRRNG
jgi:hypothetical protein